MSTPVLETGRLMLRQLDLGDVDALMATWGNGEVMRYCGGGAESRAQLAKVIENCCRYQRERGYAPYAVLWRERGAVIGTCGFNTTPEETTVELVYHFAKEYWCMGCATEAAGACVAFAFAHLKVQRIIASVDPRHSASQRVLKKLGFVLTGTQWCEETQQNDLFFEKLPPDVT